MSSQSRWMVPIAAVLVSCWAGAGVARAQNLVVNGGFDSNVTTGWGLVDGSVDWSPEDALGSPTSGSALVINDEAAVSAEVLFQCILVAESTPYIVGVDVLIESGQGNIGSGNFVVYVYGSDNCSGGPLTNVSSFTEELDTWVHLGRVLDVPAGAQSAVIRLTVSKMLTSVDFSVFMDNVSLEAALFTDGFESGNVSAWSSAVP